MKKSGFALSVAASVLLLCSIALGQPSDTPAEKKHTPKLRWRTQPPPSVAKAWSGNMVLSEAGNRLYVPTDAGGMCAVATNGRILWEYEPPASEWRFTGSALEPPCVMPDGSVCYCTHLGAVRMVSPDGKLGWEYRFPNRVPDYSRPVPFGQDEVLISMAGTSFAAERSWAFCVRKREATELGVVPRQRTSAPLALGDAVFVAGRDASLWNVDATRAPQMVVEGRSFDPHPTITLPDGRTHKLTHVEFGGPHVCELVPYGDEKLCYGAEDGIVWLVDVAKKEVVWQIDVGEPVEESPVVLPDGRIVVVTAMGTTVVLTRGPEGVTAEHPARIAGLEKGSAWYERDNFRCVDKDGNILVTHGDSSLACVTPEGEIVWDIPVARPDFLTKPLGDVVCGPDGTVYLRWFKGPIEAYR